jgi:hypothetical protein
MALASAAAAQSEDAPCLLHLGECRGEVAIRTEGRFRLVRHVPWDGPDKLEALSGELRRAVAAAMPAGSPQTGRLIVWNGADISPEALATLGENLFPDGTASGSLSTLGFVSQQFSNEAEAARFAAAAALGLGGLRPKLLPVNFQASPLAVRSKGGIRKGVLWPTVATIAVLAAVLSLLLDWRAGQKDLADLKAHLAAMKPETDRAESIVEKTSLARSSYDRTPRFLECLRRLTQAFPEEGTVWTTSVVMQAGGQGVLSGKSVDDSAVLDVLDRMGSIDGFSDVKLLFVREAAAGSREVSFTISFGFTELE